MYHITKYEITDDEATIAEREAKLKRKSEEKLVKTGCCSKKKHSKVKVDDLEEDIN